MTSLHTAIHKSNISIVNLLLQAGATTNVSFKPKNPKEIVWQWKSKVVGKNMIKY